MRTCVNGRPGPFPMVGRAIRGVSGAYRPPAPRTRPARAPDLPPDRRIFVSEHPDGVSAQAVLLREPHPGRERPRVHEEEKLVDPIVLPEGHPFLLLVIPGGVRTVPGQDP